MTGKKRPMNPRSPKGEGRFPARNEIPEGRSLCEFCEGICCRYFAVHIDTPENYQEFDFARWFLTHERASIFREGETYYLLVHSPCKFLDE